MHQFAQRLTYVLIASILTFAISSCNSPESSSGTTAKKEKTDVDVRKTYDNSGKLVASVEYKDDQRHGMAINYYSNGKPKLKVEYQNGKKHGKYSWYYEDGTLYKDADYIEGLLDGLERYYREDGSIKYETPYKAGSPGTGFVEYSISGEPKKYLESLEITISSRNKVSSSGMYSMFLGLTDYANVKEVYYYLGDLVDGRYLHEDLEELYTSNKAAEAHVDKSKGSSISVSAEILTKDKKTIVLQKTHKLPF